jgi:hypothetical protein
MANTKIRVGDYLAIGSEKEWKVMEQFGDYRMLKKTFTTQAAALARAKKLNAKRASRSLLLARSARE